MGLTFTRELDPLASSGLELEDPSQDLRGREVLDRDGESVGTVTDMMIDPGLRIARLLIVGHGGLLGMGKKQHLIPLEALRRGDEEQVRIDRAKDDILAMPEYHAAEGEEEELQYADVYAAYGIRPYWEPEVPSTGSSGDARQP